jgi:TP901-1 family phage major tail protein
MATDNIINGTLCVLKTGADHAGATAFAFSTSASISLSMDTRDISNKSSAGWRELLEAQMSWSASVEGLYAMKDSASGSIKNYEELFALLTGREPVYLELCTGVSGDLYYYGQVYCTSLEQTAPMEDNMSFSASFEGTAALTEDTEA